MLPVFGFCALLSTWFTSGQHLLPCVLVEVHQGWAPQKTDIWDWDQKIMKMDSIWAAHMIPCGSQGEVWYWHWLHGTLERDALGPEPKQYMLVVGPWCILPPVEVVLGMSLSWRLPLRIPRTDVLLSARRFSMAPNTASQDANLGTELVLLVATLMLLGYSRYWHMA